MGTFHCSSHLLRVSVYISHSTRHSQKYRKWTLARPGWCLTLRRSTHRPGGTLSPALTTLTLSPPAPWTWTSWRGRAGVKGSGGVSRALDTHNSTRQARLVIQTRVIASYFIYNRDPL